MYIVIEKHGGWEYATVVTDEDGENKVFDTIEEAEEEADECQDAIIVGDEEVEDTEKDTLKYLVKELYEAVTKGGTTVHIQDLIEKYL